MRFAQWNSLGCPPNYLGRLGDDFSDGGGDGGGTDAFSGSTADAAGTSYVDPSTIPGYTGPGSSDFQQVPLDTTFYDPTGSDQINWVNPNPNASLLGTDEFGISHYSDGSQITSFGTYIDPSGNAQATTGGQFLSNGTYIDPQGNVYAPNSPQAQQAQAAGSGGGSGGGSGSGSPRGGGGSGSGQQPLSQAMACMVNPHAPGCSQSLTQQQQRGVIPQYRQAASSSSSFTNFLSQNAGWLIGTGVIVFLLPSLLPSGGRR